METRLSALARLSVSVLSIPVLAFLIGARQPDLGQAAADAARAPSATATAAAPAGSGNVETPRLDFTVTGEGGERSYFVIPVRTEDLLKVRIEAAPGQILRNPNVWNFSAPYRCVRFTVSALGRTVTTATLKTPGAEASGDDEFCKDAPSSQEFDFSSLITPHSGPINVEISADAYDFNCQACNSNPALYNAINGCNVYCPLNAVYKGHAVGGNVILQLSGANAGVINPPSGLER